MAITHWFRSARKTSQTDALTSDDLRASIGKGPQLDPEDIASTYLTDEEFLDSIASDHSGTSPQ